MYQSIQFDPDFCRISQCLQSELKQTVFLKCVRDDVQYNQFRSSYNFFFERKRPGDPSPFIFSNIFPSPGCGGYSGNLETERVGRLRWFHRQWLKWPQRSPATRGTWNGTIGELSSMMQDGWNMVEYWSDSKRFSPFFLHCSWLLHDWQLPKSAKQLISARGDEKW